MVLGLSESVKGEINLVKLLKLIWFLLGGLFQHRLVYVWEDCELIDFRKRKQFIVSQEIKKENLLWLPLNNNSSTHTLRNGNMDWNCGIKL